MKTSNPVLDSIVETQTQFLNNWMDSAKKMQNAFTSSNVSETPNIYKEFFDKQMNVLNSMRSPNGQSQNHENGLQDFFRNWFNQQASYAKQMADFTQSIQNSFVSFGRPANEYMSAFGQSNTAFTNIYNSWMNALNASFEAMNSNMKNGFNKDVFNNYMQGNQVVAKMQEFFQPMAEAMKSGKFDLEAYKNYFNADSYKNLAKQMFGNFYHDANMSEVYHNSLHQLQNFFTTQNNLGKEYYSQLQNMKQNFPQLFGNVGGFDLKQFYGQAENIFEKTFEPLLRVVTPGKEKENVEELIGLMDKMTAYSIKQAELQMFLQETARKGVEKVAEKYAEKMTDPSQAVKAPDANEMYSEWVKTNEELFTELFASEEFSKVKGDTLNLSMEVKKAFEQQFEQAFGNYPVVFRSEAEEMQKTIYELKKQVKELRSKLSLQEVEADEDKTVKNKKK